MLGRRPPCPARSFFFFNDTATTEIYTLSLHDALPISFRHPRCPKVKICAARPWASPRKFRSEEHTSELQSHLNLVCRLLLEKKNSKRFRASAQSPASPCSMPSSRRYADSSRRVSACVS